jgi:hypothetical protein
VLQILNPTYTLRVEITDRFPEPQVVSPGATSVTNSTFGRQFSNGLTGKTGCDEVLALVRDALESKGVKHFTVSLERFEQK